MTLFFADLDNTLIYSYKQDIGTDTVAVERYEGRDISFMTKTSHQKLQTLGDILVPTTTRSLAQYQRIDLGLSPQYALVANGGILLVAGQIDKSWYDTSRQETEGCRPQMEQALSYLQQDRWVNFELRWVDDLFLFTKSEQPQKTAKELESVLAGCDLAIHTNGSKVYVLPPALTKGWAVERLCQRLSPSLTLGAGDSLFDCAMLQRVDHAFAPKTLEGEQEAHWKIIPEGVVFSDSILAEIEGMGIT